MLKFINTFSPHLSSWSYNSLPSVCYRGELSWLPMLSKRAVVLKFYAVLTLWIQANDASLCALSDKSSPSPVSPVGVGLWWRRLREPHERSPDLPVPPGGGACEPSGLCPACFPQLDGEASEPGVFFLGMHLTVDWVSFMFVGLWKVFLVKQFWLVIFL